MIRILTDSTADLTPDLVEEHHIHVIPLLVHIDGRSYHDDGVDIGRREFYSKLRSCKNLPTTSQPSMGDFQKTFSELTHDGSEVICITISSQMSGTFAAAKAASDALAVENIHVVDSRLVSVALGQVAIRAAEDAAKGLHATEILARVAAMRENFGIAFCVDTLDYLHKGGRIGAASALVGRLLDIRPILTITDGQIQSLGRARTRQAAWDSMLKLLEEQVPAGSKVSGAIAHGDNPMAANWFAGQIRSRYDCTRLFIAEIGPVAGTHVGPGALGAAIVPYTCCN